MLPQKRPKIKIDELLTNCFFGYRPRDGKMPMKKIDELLDTKIKREQIASAPPAWCFGLVSV
jgi:hypothetical protein